MLSADELIKRYDYARQRAMLSWALFDRAYSYIIPDKNLYRKVTEGANKNPHVFDTTAGKACQKFVSKVQASLIPPEQRWVNFIIGPRMDMELEQMPNGESLRKKITEGLQETTDIFFKYLNKSNFKLVANETFYDLAIGTGAMVCNEGDSDDDPLLFATCPLRFYFPEEGPHGQINTQWREIQDLPARNVLRLWPDAKIPREMEEIIKKDGDSKLQFAEGSIYHPDKKMYEYVVIWMSNREPIYRTFSESSPWIVFRWSRVENEVFGRGPCIDALPTVISLNTMFEYELLGAAFKATPMYTGFSDGVFNPNTVKLKPNTIIPVSPGALGSGPLTPLTAGGDVTFNQMMVADLRNQINEWFFAEPLGPMKSPDKTATEIEYRMQMFAEEVGPAFGRLQVEFLDAVVKRVMFILHKRGLVKGDVFKMLNGKDIDIAYESPLAQAVADQKIRKFKLFMADMQQMVGPQLSLAAVNITKVPQWLGEQYDAPMELIKDSDELDVMMQQLQQMHAANQAQLPQPGVTQLSQGGA